MSSRVVPIVVSLVVAMAVGCGDDETKKEDETSSEDDTSTSSSDDTSGPAAGDLDPERQCQVKAYCERKCESECEHEERDRTAFFEAKRAKAASPPFQVEVQRSYFNGSCHKGGDPKRRRDASGIAAVVEGTLTYTGTDLLHYATLGGSMYLRFGEERYAEVSASGKKYSYYGRDKRISKFERPVRGSDPWIKGQTRKFHWESRYISAAYCEVVPDLAEAYIAVDTVGVYEGSELYPVRFVPLQWDEVVGMALTQKVQLQGRGYGETVLKPATASFSKLGKLLVTDDDGKSRWVKRTTVVHNQNTERGAAAALPAEAGSDEWKLSVKSISTAKQFGDYEPKGEDEFLAIVELELKYTPAVSEGDEPKPGRLAGFGVKLETAPGRWKGAVRQAPEQMEMGGEVEPNGTRSGKLVFPRQRFERPFRLEVKLPDRTTKVVDVFSYDIGPERARK